MAHAAPCISEPSSLHVPKPPSVGATTSVQWCPCEQKPPLYPESQRHSPGSAAVGACCPDECTQLPCPLQSESCTHSPTQSSSPRSQATTNPSSAGQFAPEPDCGVDTAYTLLKQSAPHAGLVPGAPCGAHEPTQSTIGSHCSDAVSSPSAHDGCTPLGE